MADKGCAMRMECGKRKQRVNVSHEYSKTQHCEDEHAHRRQDVGQLRHEIGSNLRYT